MKGIEMRHMIDWPLCFLAINAISGMAVVLWMVASVGPFLLGYGDVVPGKEIAVVLASCWTGWNWRALMKDTPNDPS
jgi:hypothetical protein